MGFVTDSQTLSDLQLLGRGDHAVINLFDRTVTRGGAELLEDMFRYPLSDAEAINRRAAVIGDLTAAQAAFPFRPELFDAIEQYLSNTDERTRLAPEEQSLGKKLTGFIAEDVEYKNIYKGVTAVIEVLHTFRDFINGMDRGEDSPYNVEKQAIKALLLNPAFEPLLKERAGGKLSYNRVAAYDVLLRWRHRDDVKKVLRHVYYLDVYLTVAGVARQRGFVFAKALDGDGLLQLEGMYHPHLKKPICAR